MRLTRLAALAALLAPAAAGAQSAMAAAAPSPSLAVTSARDLWINSRDNVTAAAEQMPEASWGYKPTPEVRSFGEIVQHVAAAQYMFCGMVRGEKERDISAMKTKAEVVDALKASNAYCEPAYATTDADASAPLDIFGEHRSRLHALFMNAWHDSEHYGNIVTYMRLKGMVPPSSQPRK